MDISATGMLLLPSHRASRGLRMSIDLGFPRLECIRVDAVLAREADAHGSYAWGVRFTNVPTYVRSLLRDYVAQRIKGIPDDEMVFSADRQRLAAPTPVIAPAIIPMGDHNDHVVRISRPYVPPKHLTEAEARKSGLYLKVFHSGEQVEKVIQRPGFYRRVIHTPSPTTPALPPTVAEKRSASPATSVSTTASKHSPRGSARRSRPARSRQVVAKIQKVARLVRGDPKAEEREREETPVEVRELYNEALRDLDRKEPARKEPGRKRRRRK